jgi:predicted XRE-type DNA-binding protein
MRRDHGARVTDVDFAKRQLTVARSAWKGHVTMPKGGRLRYVPMTKRLTEVLREARHTEWQAEVARVLRVTQPRVSDLLRGRIDLFSTDALIDLLASLGVGVRLLVRPGRPKQVA